MLRCEYGFKPWANRTVVDRNFPLYLKGTVGVLLLRLCI